MENEPKPINRLEELQELIARAAPLIEAEFSRTANSWLNCFGSKVFQVETYLSSPKVEELLSQEAYQRALSNAEALKERLHELKEQYPDKATVPPDEIKQELLQALDVFEEV
jgi:hypothetical protein